MPKRKQRARADRLAAKAARDIQRTIVTLVADMAALPKVPLHRALQCVGDRLWRRNAAAYVWLQEMI